MIASPGYTKRNTMIWYTTSSTSARINTLPTLFHPSLIISSRWPGSDRSAQKYGGLPARGSAHPPRIGKKETLARWSTKLHFIGPQKRANYLLSDRPHK